MKKIRLGTTAKAPTLSPQPASLMLRKLYLARGP